MVVVMNDGDGDGDDGDYLTMVEMVMNDVDDNDGYVGNENDGCDDDGDYLAMVEMVMVVLMVLLVKWCT